MEFIRLTTFEKRAKEIGFTEGQVMELELALTQNPEAGDLIPSGAGLRKVRCAFSGRGKRGGARVIYYYVATDSTILLATVFAKNEASDIPKDALKQLVKIIKG